MKVFSIRVIGVSWHKRTLHHRMRKIRNFVFCKLRCDELGFKNSNSQVPIMPMKEVIEQTDRVV